MEYIKFKISKAITRQGTQQQVVIHELESNIPYIDTYDLPIILNALQSASIDHMYFTLDSSQLDGSHILR